VKNDHRLNIDSQSLTSGAFNNSSNNNDNDDDHSKEKVEDDINRPQHPSLEPSTPEALIED